jgi:ParB/RepB/Spo0J family partition protein
MKAPQRSKPVFRGLSTDQLEHAQQQASSLMPFIRLPVRGLMLQFELVTIEHADIDTATVVDDENYRDQQLLNAYSLSDILPSLADDGQQFPGFGYRTESGVIKVVDGSRRRAGCKLTGRPYLVYVAKEEISPEDVRHVSKIANISKALSLYERGAMYQAMLADGLYPDNKSLAIAENENESTVSLALQIRRFIPAQWVQFAPSVYDLGRPAWQTLIKYSQSDSIKTAISQYLACFESPDQYFATLKNDADTPAASMAAMNKQFMDSLAAQIVHNKPKAAPPAILASKGKSTAVVLKSSASGFTVKIDGIDDKTREKLELAIQSVIQGTK